VSPAELIPLLLKAGLTAAVVVVASMLAERSRPAIAATILSLPISAGPTYALLALQHDAAFIARSTFVGLPLNLATVMLVLAYGLLARRGGGLLPSLVAGWSAWAAVAVLLSATDWSLGAVILINAAGFALGIVATARWTAPAVVAPPRRWWDLPARAAVVGALTATVVGLSAVIGPSRTGVLAALPVAYSSFMLIMHPRIGGRATAAMMGRGLVMLVGFALGLFAFHLAAVGGEVGWGLVLFCLVPVIYSALLLGAASLRGRRTG
jgi:hypothetical protein